MHSATVWASPYLYATEFGATVDVAGFLECLQRRAMGERVEIPLEVEQSLLDTVDADLEPVRELIISHRLGQLRSYDAKIEALAKRISGAADASANPPSKGRPADQRRWARDLLDVRAQRQRLLQSRAHPLHAHISPGSVAPVMIVENGILTVRPMRFRCRPARMDAKADRLLTGAHVVSVAALNGLWRDHFGSTHGVVALQAFHEIVGVHHSLDRPLSKRNPTWSVHLRWAPEDGEPLYIACIWAHWKGADGADLRSFAMISTDAHGDMAAGEPLLKLAVLKRDQVAAWLSPTSADLVSNLSLLDDPPQVSLCFSQVEATGLMSTS